MYQQHVELICWWFLFVFMERDAWQRDGGRAGKANAAEQIHCKNKQKQLNAICGGRSLFCGAPTLLSHWVGNTVVCMALLYTCLCACMHSWQHVGTLLTVCRWCPGISSQTCTDTSRPIGAQLDLGQWNQRAPMPSSSRNCSTLATWGWPSFCPRMNPEQNVNHGISRLPDVWHVFRVNLLSSMQRGLPVPVLQVPPHAASSDKDTSRTQNERRVVLVLPFSPVVTFICSKAGETDHITWASYVDRLMSLKFTWLGVTIEYFLIFVEQM